MINANAKTKDPELEEILETIRQMKPAVQPDVTNAVMQRIGTMPSPVQQQPVRRLSMRFVSGLAAACFAGIVVVTFIITHNQGVQAANVNAEMSMRLYDIYQYCDNYAADESIEDAAYYDNPVTDLF